MVCDDVLIVGLVCWGVSEYNIGAVGEWFAHRLVGFAAHDDRMIQSELFKPFLVLRQAPRDLIILPDHAVLGNGGDKDDVWLWHGL